jgi:hypothetical protein
MGLRFDLTTANWLAYLIEPGAPLPRMDNPWMEREALRRFLDKLEHQFYSSHRRESEFRNIVGNARSLLHRLDDTGPEGSSSFVLEELRRDLGNRPWTALVVPSGEDWELDRFLCSEDLLMRLVGVWSEDPGLVLQIEHGPDEPFSLLDVFPAFKTALAHLTQWPGILIWLRSGDSRFFPFLAKSRGDIEEQATFLLRQLGRRFGGDLARLDQDYRSTFAVASQESRAVHLLQISDIHIGSEEASRRLPRVQQLIRNLLDEIEEGEPVVPIVSGDLMDSPNEKLLDQVRAFLDFLSNLGTEPPVVILGNHDVRKDGYLGKQLDQALKIPTTNLRVLDNHGVAVVGFNSVVSGHLARGLVGEQQYIDLGNAIDRLPDRPTLVGVVHHHPMPVELPEWYSRPFYERVLGKAFEKTDALEDAKSFLSFVEGRGFAAVLHGHKHIPRIGKTPEAGLPIYGCGSSVGKVPSRDSSSTYMSVNVVTIDKGTGRLSGRLLAERIPGAGLKEEKRHEVVHKGQLESTSKRVA